MLRRDFLLLLPPSARAARIHLPLGWRLAYYNIKCNTICGLSEGK